MLAFIACVLLIAAFHGFLARHSQSQDSTVVVGNGFPPVPDCDHFKGSPHEWAACIGYP